MLITVEKNKTWKFIIIFVTYTGRKQDTYALFYKLQVYTSCHRFQ